MVITFHRAFAVTLNGLACRWKSFLALGLAGGCLLLCALPAKPDGVVNDCTTPIDLTRALIGGGLVTFGCNETVTLANTLTIATNTILDGSGQFPTISATNGFRLFNVAPGVQFAIINLTLANGQSTIGGCIFNQGILVASNCTFAGNNALGTNGVAGASGQTNSANGGGGAPGRSGIAGLGGAIYNTNSGLVILTGCSFITNSAKGGSGGSGGTGGGGEIAGGDGGSGGSGAAGYGGAIYNLGHVSLTNCTFSNNQAVGGNGAAGGAGGVGGNPGNPGNGGAGAPAAGAGLYNMGVATVVACTFAGHSAIAGSSANGGVRAGGVGYNGLAGGSSLGGAVCNLSTNTLINCTFSANQVSGGNAGNGGNGDFGAGDGGNGGTASGGGFYNSGQAGVTNCTLSGGGAVGGVAGTSGGPSGSDGVAGASRGANISSAAGALFLKNSILANPTSGTNTITSTNVTCSTNFSYSTNLTFTTNGGIITVTGTNVTLTATNVVCDTNTVTSTTPGSVANSFGAVSDAGYNLSSDNTPAFSVAKGSHNKLDPRLAPLGTNGGPTMTFALLAGSPAIDAGDPAFLLPVDQRGAVRSPPGDIGAYEAAGIHGTIVSDAGSLSNVVVTASGPVTKSGLSDANGNYAILPLPIGTYSVTAFRPGFGFDPGVTNVAVGFDTNAVNFTAFPLYSISGTITNGSQPLSGVIVTAGTESAITDSNGNYTVTGLRAGAYDVTPALLGYGFTPAAAHVSLSASISGVGFAAYQTLFTLGGHVAQNGIGIGGVMLSVVSPSMSQSLITSADGSYRLSGLAPDTYLIVPAAAGYDFDPPAQSVDVSADTTNVDFSATGIFSISGQIAGAVTGTTVGLFAGTNSVLSAETAPDGAYTIMSVGPGAYSVQPSSTIYVFNPISRSVTVGPNGPNLSGVDFTAVAVYSISGHITDGTNNLAGVTVSAGGQTATTGTNGNYILTAVPAGLNSVTASLLGFQFDPISVNLTSDLTGVDFVGITTFTISGRLTEGAIGASNVVVSLLVGTNQAISDANGFYSITGVRAGTNGVKPILAGYNFSPQSMPVKLGPSTNGVNFSATGTLSISGFVTSQSGAPVGNVTVTAGSKTGTAAANGSFTITGLAPRTFTVTPLLARYAFNPPATNVTLAGASANNVNFAAIPLFTVSGRVKEGTNALSSVTLTAINSSPPATNTAITDANGNYTLSNVRAGANIVTPSRADYQFAPTSLAVTLGSNTNLPDFVGSHVFKIQGRITESGLGIGVSNVIVSMGSMTAQTDTNGNYTFSGVSAGSTNILTPSLGGYVFTPSTLTVTAVANRTGVDFTATGIYSVRGHITENNTNVSNVTIRVGTKQATSDANGNYIISSLAPRSYTATPSSPGQVFNPLSRLFTVGPNANNVDFIAIPTYNLSGRVIDASTDGTNGPGLSGATIIAVSLVPPLTNTVQSDSFGYYTLSGVPAATNTLTPAKLGYVFSPINQSVVVTNNASVNDFFAYQAAYLTISLSSGVATLSVQAVPLRTYNIQAAANLGTLSSNIDWQTIATTNADVDGRFQILDPNAVNFPFRFYRTRTP